MKIENVPIADLLPDPSNARKHKEKNISAIKGSLVKFGQQKPIVINKDNIVIAGNGTLEAAKALGWSNIKVVRSDLDKLGQTAFAIADNRSSELAEWDLDVLGKSLEALEDDFALEDLGFDEDDIAKLTPHVSAPGLIDDDEVPETNQNEFGVVTGDIWQLGRHRLMCGDSTNVEQVERLMDGKKADMVFTDPPYRMQVEGGSNQPIGRAAAKLGEAIKHLCDFDPKAFLSLLPSVFENKKMNAYIFCNKDLVPDYLIWARDCGYSFNILFWKKPNAIPLGEQHRPDVEYLLLFRKSAIWNNAVNGVNYSKCLEFSREKSADHPTLKPVELIINEIKISSNGGGVVSDLFLGSGSTLIACEKTNRTCYGMEIDPHYCSVIIKRWQDFTGKEAVRLSDEKPDINPVKTRKLGTNAKNTSKALS